MATGGGAGVGAGEGAVAACWLIFANELEIDSTAAYTRASWRNGVC